MPRIAAVIVAGGSGDRFGAAGGKQLAVLAGRPILAWTVEAFGCVDAVDELVVVCHPERVAEYRSEAVAPLGIAKSVRVVAGGGTRQESVAAGMAAVSPEVSIVLVHDGARPLITTETIEAALRALDQTGADGIVVGHPSVDTLKLVDGDKITATPDRAAYWAVQTPQVFRAQPLRDAHAAAQRGGFIGTDDASLVERVGGDVRVVEGPRDNIKVTLPEDLAFAEAVLRHR
ncbi:MAG: 2-C-methyl-D-erythritol 4-phosphate cytidylyltransferase, partial [Actinobacteria bacterium]